MDGRLLQGRDQSGHYSRSIRNDAFEVQETLRRSERLAKVVSATEGETKEQSRREHEELCSDSTKRMRKHWELGNEDEEGRDKRKED